MGFSRQECWSGLPFPSPGDLPNPGIQPGSPTLQPDTLPSEPPGRSLYTKKNVKVLVTQSCLTLCNSMDYSPPGFCLWNYPGKNSGVGCHSLLPGFKGHFKSSTQTSLENLKCNISMLEPLLNPSINSNLFLSLSFLQQSMVLLSLHLLKPKFGSYPLFLLSFQLSLITSSSLANPTSKTYFIFMLFSPQKTPPSPVASYVVSFLSFPPISNRMIF